MEGSAFSVVFAFVVVSSKWVSGWCYVGVGHVAAVEVLDGGEAERAAWGLLVEVGVIG